MLFQVCCETGFSRLNLIMTKMRNNLLVVTLDALMMLFINGPSLEPDVPSPTIELSELCKLGYLHWTKAKNRNSRRCHHMSRARAHEVTAEHHNVYHDAPVLGLFCMTIAKMRERRRVGRVASRRMRVRVKRSRKTMKRRLG